MCYRRRALLVAAVFVMSCKKQPPKGDLPPPVAPPTSATATPPAPPAAAPANPHGAMGAPHGAIPEQTPPKTLEPLPEGRVAMGPFSLAPPAGWTAKPITSSMRAADFVLPAKAGAEAELIVTYFGPNGAGSLDDNVNRWVGQFTQPDGKTSRDAAKTEKLTLAGQEATVISISGHYAAQAMPGGAAAVDKQDQALLAAIVASPSGPYYFKLVGAKSTIDANAAAFRAMLTSMKLR
jgi:hypothetical protein